MSEKTLSVLQKYVLYFFPLQLILFSEIHLVTPSVLQVGNSHCHHFSYIFLNDFMIRKMYVLKMALNCTF